MAGGQGRSHDGKMLVAGAVECVEGGRAGRIRLAVIADFTGGDAERRRRGEHRGLIDDPRRRLLVLSRHEGRKHVPKPVRSDGGARAAAADPPGFLEPEAARARRLPRLPPSALPSLPRRVHLPMKPTAALPFRL